MSRKLPLSEGEVARTACARGLLRTGVVEKTGEVLSAAALTQRVDWAAEPVSGMAAELLAGHWNATDVDVLASGEDVGGRKLPSNAWMALRRLGWTAAPADGVRVNDRIVRMAQEQAGRALRSAHWRAELTSAVLRTWPCDPGRRTPEEWERVREAVPGGRHLPSSVIRSRTRQITAFAGKNGRLPTGVFELEAPPRTARMLLLSACDGQQATIERGEEDPQRALLRLKLPTRPDPRSYRDRTWVACPVTLLPTVPPGAVLHLPTLRITGSTVRADLAYTHAVPGSRRTGHIVALGVDWGLNTLLSAGAARLHDDGSITALGTGAQFRAAPRPGRMRLAGRRRPRRLQRITARGLAHQARTVTDRATGQMMIRTVVDTLETQAVITPTAQTSRADRSKTGPTRRKPTRPAPRRRRAPSPTGPTSLAGKRPEGHAPTDRRTLPRAAHRNQGVTTISTPTTSRHRPRGAALGAGFHLHAHAPPPQWAQPMPDALSGMG
ncbi:hypothetical protein JIX56_26320 [Streptomyces sp. CA-210063]|uniref:hypothetical protein n=1 Tax=Streptomyces sp. CA-210063 TaxID=2801029 RepID=UPI00214C4C57|nr:hypothetical protein [Streptomyces sp. CA-210063]UUU33102.1 hypothetical protein JIX56_26320 [Streptomyces sp. CA-210063]